MSESVITLLQKIVLLQWLTLFAVTSLVGAFFLFAYWVRRGAPQTRQNRPKKKAFAGNHANTHVHPMPPYASALLRAVMANLEHTYALRKNAVWDRVRDPVVSGLVYRPYVQDQEETGLGNLEVEGVSIQWYRFPGNYDYSDREWSEGEWCAWYDRVCTRLASGTLNT